MKKIICILTLVISLSFNFNYEVKATSMESPKNISVTRLNGSYVLKFKNNINKTSIKSLKYEIDIKADANNWASSNNKLLVRPFVNNKTIELKLSEDEINKLLGKDYENYNFRVRISDGNNKSDFSSSVTVGSISIFNNSSNWAINDLNKAKERMIITNSMLKDMKGAITREEFAEIIVKAAESANIVSTHESYSSFKDTNNLYVGKAKAIGLMVGYTPTHFGAKDKITKQDAAVVINKLMEKSGLNKDTSIVIKDGESINKYATQSVNNVVSNKILVLSNGKFNPKDNITRESAVIALLRLINKSV